MRDTSKNGNYIFKLTACLRLLNLFYFILFRIYNCARNNDVTSGLQETANFSARSAEHIRNISIWTHFRLLLTQLQRLAHHSTTQNALPPMAPSQLSLSIQTLDPEWFIGRKQGNAVVFHHSTHPSWQSRHCVVIWNVKQQYF